MKIHIAKSSSLKLVPFILALFVSVILQALLPTAHFAENASDNAHAASWPQFLGPQRNGISSETGLLKSWPAGGPRQVWSVAGGVGMSGLAIDDGRLIPLLQRDGKQMVVALDAKTGKSIWEAIIGPEYRNQMGDGPRATPAIVGKVAYAFSGEGVLLAVNVSDGKILWRRNLLEDFQAKSPAYGMACSPLVVGKLVYVITGAPGAAVVAIDRISGQTVWKSGDDPSGYSSPTLLNVGGRQQLVIFNGKAALGLQPQTGQQLWRYPYKTDYNCNIATPLSFRGKVFISSGENHGSALLSLKPKGEGFLVEESWISHGARSVMRNEWQTSILLDGFLYGFDNVGGAGPISHFNCVDIASGEKVWQQLRYGKGNMIAADGKLFMVTIDGELVVVRANPKSYDEIGRAEVIGPTRQAPSLAGGLLYLRDDQKIICLDVRGN